MAMDLQVGDKIKMKTCIIQVKAEPQVALPFENIHFLNLPPSLLNIF